MSELGPSFYGEVLAATSRAVDEEEDEEDAECIPSSSSVLRWSPEAREKIESQGGITCNVLVLAIDAVATGFVQTYFLHQEVERIGVLCSGLSEKCENSLDQDAFTDETCYIYRLKNQPSVVFCQCNTKVSAEQSFSWVDKLFSGVKAVHTYVAVLSHKTVHEYKSEEMSSQLSVPFLRALKTHHYQGTPLSPYLEQPNIIDGLPAQIMTYCQVHELPAVYYICYTENIYLDIDSLNEFSRLTSVTPFKDFYVKNAKAAEELRKLVDQSNNKNMLYM